MIEQLASIRLLLLGSVFATISLLHSDASGGEVSRPARPNFGLIMHDDGDNSFQSPTRQRRSPASKTTLTASWRAA